MFINYIIDATKLKAFAKEYKIHSIIDENEVHWFRLKYTDPSKAIRQHINAEDEKKFSDLSGNLKRIPHNAQPHSIYINKNGLCKLIISAKKSIALKLARDFGIQCHNKISYKEIDIVQQLDAFCETSNIRYKPQKSVVCDGKQYYVDYYLLEYKIAIEIDENGHRHRNPKSEQLRQKRITKKLGCQFIWYNPDNKTEHIGILFGKIHSMIMDQ